MPPRLRLAPRRRIGRVMVLDDTAGGRPQRAAPTSRVASDRTTQGGQA